MGVQTKVRQKKTKIGEEKKSIRVGRGEKRGEKKTKSIMPNTTLKIKINYRITSKNGTINIKNITLITKTKDTILTPSVQNVEKNPRRQKNLINLMNESKA